MRVVLLSSWLVLAVGCQGASPAVETVVVDPQAVERLNVRHGGRPAGAFVAGAPDDGEGALKRRLHAAPLPLHRLRPPGVR